MAYELYIGDRTYSSWSLRGWLLFRKFGIPCRLRQVDFSLRDVQTQVSVPPSRTVPTMVAPDGAVVWDSLAIAEELASRHPSAGLWPDDPAARATARSMTAEMHSGFGALRSECPMHLGAAYADFHPSREVRADVARIERIWAHARDRFESGPWLFGTYCAADAFFAPVAARFATYGLGTGDAAKAYVAAHLADSAFREWRRDGLETGKELPWYAMPLARRDWPGPA